MSADTRIDVFYNEVSSLSASIYVRGNDFADTEGVTLQGTVQGPECHNATTLPATIPLRTVHGADPFLAKAVVPDPCCWSPHLPATYRVRVEIVRKDIVVAVSEHTVGLKSLHTDENSLYLESRRWVLRAAYLSKPNEVNLNAWRKTGLAMYVEEPSEKLCQQASELGILIIGSITNASHDIAARLRELSCWPALAIAVLDPSVQNLAHLSRFAPNLLLAQHIDGESLNQVCPDCALVFADVSKISDLSAISAQSYCPIIATRQVETELNITNRRTACDHLQRDLAPIGDFAGYCV